MVKFKLNDKRGSNFGKRNSIVLSLYLTFCKNNEADCFTPFIIFFDGQTSFMND